VIREVGVDRWLGAKDRENYSGEPWGEGICGGAFWFG